MWEKHSKFCNFSTVMMIIYFWLVEHDNTADAK